MFLLDNSEFTATVTTVSCVQIKQQLDLVRATGVILTEFLDSVVSLHLLAKMDLFVDQVVMAEWFALVTSKSYLLFL